MRVMLMIKGDPEPGAAPSDEILAAMGKYNDELQKAGVWTWRGCSRAPRGGGEVRRREPRRHRRAIPQSKQLIAGYWILQVPSMDEAVEWAKRARRGALPHVPRRVRRHGRDRNPPGVEMEDLDASNSGG